MAITRPAGLPDRDARPPKGTPARAQLERDAAWLVTPYGGAPLPPELDGMVDTPTPQMRSAADASINRKLAALREKDEKSIAREVPDFEKLTQAQVDAALRAPTPKADQLVQDLKAMRDLTPEVRDMKLD